MGTAASKALVRVDVFFGVGMRSLFPRDLALSIVIKCFLPSEACSRGVGQRAGEGFSLHGSVPSASLYWVSVLGDSLASPGLIKNHLQDQIWHNL